MSPPLHTSEEGDPDDHRAQFEDFRPRIIEDGAHDRTRDGACGDQRRQTDEASERNTTSLEGNSHVSGAGTQLDSAGPHGFRAELRLEFGGQYAKTAFPGNTAADSARIKVVVVDFYANRDTNFAVHISAWGDCLRPIRPYPIFLLGSVRYPDRLLRYLRRKWARIDGCRVSAALSQAEAGIRQPIASARH